MRRDRSNLNGSSFANGNGVSGAILAVLPSTHWAVLSGQCPDPAWR